jgi:hypothetical protein
MFSCQIVLVTAIATKSITFTILEKNQQLELAPDVNFQIRLDLKYETAFRDLNFKCAFKKCFTVKYIILRTSLNEYFILLNSKILA